MRFVVLLLSLALLFSCRSESQNQENSLALEGGNSSAYRIETAVPELSNPWGMTWLPDGSMLITEKGGELIHFKNGKKIFIENLPEIYVRGQGGFLDVALHPDYANNGWIYFTHASQEGGGDGGNTKLIRAKLDGNRLMNVESLYKAMPNSTKGQHFGSRIAFDAEGYVYFSVGDRGNRDVNPQDIKRDNGKIYRLHDDGRIPEDNPFVGVAGAKEAIYSYGHRNPQGMDVHPITGDIWTHEHGPKGGDEVNIIKKGANYGWPVISYGVNYSGTSFTDKTQQEGMEAPLHYWVPSIAPCGMAFVTGDKFPAWKNHLLVGSLKFNYVELLKLDGDRVIGREKIADGIGRVRNVRIGPNGYIYIALEGQGIVRLLPN
ncbi:PQQ-dependent sugar dehydrogenase [Gilvibacter sediminis]|uniref:PQQ-dependent sugar dehydrogenase n=1 Tax=Gilvibacter sediminis TaxID=379071 RepID=UPI0023504F6F|nr:PQQ-dependent sugar dehydrogenase [Gilvibacter sediminis]MDC7998932.1 PQQ-dependent sugar dehydrogenase [Gilvibacter sediminis]